MTQTNSNHEELGVETNKGFNDLLPLDEQLEVLEETSAEAYPPKVQHLVVTHCGCVIR